LFRAGVAPTHGQWSRSYPVNPASGSPGSRVGTCAKSGPPFRANRIRLDRKRLGL